MNIAELRSVSRSRQAGANKVVIGQAKRLGARRAGQPFDDMCLARPVQSGHNNPWSRHEELQSECDANVGGGAARPTRTQPRFADLRPRRLQDEDSSSLPDKRSIQRIRKLDAPEVAISPVNCCPV